jgi:hypothetical protein
MGQWLKHETALGNWRRLRRHEQCERGAVVPAWPALSQHLASVESIDAEQVARVSDNV